MNKLALVFIFIMIVLFSCEMEDANYPGRSSFVLGAEYDSIRSCPEGGGIFILKLSNPGDDIGNVYLDIDASPELHTTCSKWVINKEFPVTEVVIRPDKETSIDDYEIKVLAINQVYDTTMSLTVSLYDWSTEIGEGPTMKKNEFIAWLKSEHPEYNIKADQEWYAYPTYPEVLIVEHVTYLNDAYEFRICKHAMIPPYDWSMIRIRKRNEAGSFFAAKQDSTGGDIYQIPVADYPELFGY